MPGVTGLRVKTAACKGLTVCENFYGFPGFVCIFAPAPFNIITDGPFAFRKAFRELY
jgi:hypothetical protein